MVACARGCGARIAGAEGVGEDGAIAGKDDHLLRAGVGAGSRAGARQAGGAAVRCGALVACSVLCDGFTP